MSIPEHEMRPYHAPTDRAWVVATWTHGLCEPEAHQCRQSYPICDVLRSPHVRCVVATAPGNPDALWGWCAAEGATLLWVYVRKLYGSLRSYPNADPPVRRGLGTTLMLAAGIDPSQPTPCRWWSPYATLMAARGYRLYPAPIDERTAA